VRLRSARRSPRAGFTLIEVLIASSIFALVISSTAMVVATSTSAHGLSSARNNTQDLARRASNRIVDELVNASSTSLFPDPGAFATSDLVFQVADGVTAGAVDWSAPKRLAFQYETGEVDDGLDNNGNGLIDEGVLVLTLDDGGPAELAVVLCHGLRELGEGEIFNGLDDNGNGLVDEGGFSVRREGSVLTVRVTVEKRGPDGELLTSTTETGVRLRN